jgi:hypothetical protein
VQADELSRFMDDPGWPAMIEPLTPSLPAVLDAWVRWLGPVSMLSDAHRVLTDDHMDMMRLHITAGHPDFRFI